MKHDITEFEEWYAKTYSGFWNWLRYAFSFKSKHDVAREAYFLALGIKMKKEV